MRDISARKAAEQSLYMAAQVFENSREGIMITDQEQRIISVNRAFTRITGYAACAPPACMQARAWLDQGSPLVVSVNLSVAQFRQKDLLQSVIDALRYANLAPQYLELEMTESILADGADNTLETLKALRKIGVKLAIDDFGTGYSSLSYLKRFSVDKVKIDQSFVRDIALDKDNAVIVTAIIAMAKKLLLRITAEGVETIEQFNFLKMNGCDEYQGFYASKALSSNDFCGFISRNCH